MDIRLSEYVAYMREIINTHTSCWRNLRVRGRLKNKTQMVRYIETDVQYIVCMCPEWTDLFRIRIGGGSVWLQHWTVGFSERRRTAGVVDGRFASRDGQTALGYTELHKRCVQEQSSRSVKLSTNLRLIPRLSICGAYCHFPIQFKMLFRAIFVPKKYFFLECGAICCDSWTRTFWIFPLPSFCGYFCILRAEAVGTTETSVPVYCSPPPNRPYAWQPVT